MIGLIIDCSAGMNLILFDGDKVDSIFDADEKKHTDELLLKLDELLKRNNVKISEVQNICVCTGPGSFTGVRVAISIAKGLAIGTGAKVFVASNFEMFSGDMSDKSILVLEGFSDNVYVRKIDGGKIVDTCEQISELAKYAQGGFEFFTTTEKMQNRLKSFEIKPKIAHFDAISCFYSKIKNNEFTQLNQIMPIYLRASQAEIERNKKLGIN